MKFLVVLAMLGSFAFADDAPAPAPADPAAQPAAPAPSKPSKPSKPGKPGQVKPGKHDHVVIKPGPDSALCFRDARKNPKLQDAQKKAGCKPLPRPAPMPAKPIVIHPPVKPHDAPMTPEQAREHAKKKAEKAQGK